MLGLVVFGSRTWMCTIAAPALAASRQELAICSGVTGTAGLRPGVSAEPVTAQEIITLRAIFSLPDLVSGRQPSGRVMFGSFALQGHYRHGFGVGVRPDA